MLKIISTREWARTLKLIFLYFFFFMSSCVKDEFDFDAV